MIEKPLDEARGKKVFVGLSGGVDSSVSVALLKEQGYDVTGVFIKVWHPDFLECSWPEERRSAMRAAAVLDIPFLTLDLEKEYKEYVVDYMISEYKAGRTPNPDVMCNQHIKFGGFLDFARENGADFVATGHYARRIDTDGITTMHEGIDREKDQSYFIWTMKQENLKHVLFPVGNIEKSEVRKLAEKFGLHTATKKDSQGLCFLGKVDMKDFLKNFIDEKEGNVLDESGEVVGTHEGAFYYTIGQRHGFEIKTKDTNRKPYFVVSKDIDANTITVSNNPKESAANPKEVTLTDVNWIRGIEPCEGEYECRIRYRQQRQRCTVQRQVSNARRWTVSFEEAQQGLSVGQSLVIYNGTECLGGGIVN